MSQRLPRQGDQVVYRPRVPYGRQSELTALVTRVWDAEKGDIDIVTFPSQGESQRMEHIARAAETIKLHCWDYVGDDPRLAALEEMVMGLMREIEALKGNTKTRKREPDLVGG